MNNNYSMGRSRHRIKSKPLKFFRRCLVCMRNIKKANVPQHHLSLEHINSCNRAYADSPAVDVKGMGLDASHEECHKYFSSFGAIENIVVQLPHDPGITRITFKRVEDAISLKRIKGPLYYKSSQLYIWSAYYKLTAEDLLPVSDSVIKYGSKKPPTREGKVSSLIQHQIDRRNDKKKIRNKNKPKFLEMNVPAAISLNLQGDFNDQLFSLMSHVRLSVSDVDNMKVVCEDLENSLRKTFPACRILPFGSIVNGLGFVGSDIDCFCDLRSPLQGPDTDKDTELAVLRKAKKVLYGQTYKYTNIICIANCKVPIIKLKHIKTNINVDISFKSPLGVANSELTRYLLSSDDRLLPLAIFIKYWAKSMSFIGPSRFNSYSLTLLLLFYLQRLDKPILPPVAYLQRNPQYDNYIGLWNAGFSKQCMPINQNTQSVLSLIEGFFDFYGEFVFEGVVICPYTGLAIPKQKFDDLDLPIEYKHFVDCVSQGKVINITHCISASILQDPFQLNRSCTGSIPGAIIEDFKLECLASSQVIKMARSSNSQSNLIVNLTSLCKILPNIISDQPLSYFLPINMSNIQTAQGYSNSQIEEIRCHIEQMIEVILTNVAKCRYTLNSSSSMGKPNGMINVPQMSFKCEVFFNMWSSRNEYRKFDGLRTVQQEAAASDEMFNKLYINQNPQTPLVSFTMDVLINIKSQLYQIILQPVKSVTNFYEIINLILPIVELELRQYVV